jgi:hypothetical protein
MQEDVKEGNAAQQQQQQQEQEQANNGNQPPSTPPQSSGATRIAVKDAKVGGWVRVWVCVCVGR